MDRYRILALTAALCLTLAGCSSSDSTKKAEAPAAPSKPEPVPEVFHVKLETSKGLIDIEVHRAWAPNGADHFHRLAQTGFFDNARFFRVVRNFVVQFGINGDPKTNSMWANANIPDDPEKEHNVKGTVTFANLGPGTRTTQLFINLNDNRKSLDRKGFAPIGKVVAGMDVVESLYNSYGEVEPRGQGPDPAKIQQQGNEYLESHFPRLDFIKKASVQ